MLRVPKAVADQSYQLFPEGIYAGKFLFNTDNSNGEVGSDGWRFSLRVGFTDLKPANNETPDPGGRPFGGDIVVVWDGVSLSDLDETSRYDQLSFPLQKGLSLLCQLGEVMGAAQRTEEGDVVIEDLSQFVEEIRAHGYDGRPVIVEVSHYTPKGGKKPDDTRDQIGGISTPE